MPEWSTRGATGGGRTAGRTWPAPTTPFYTSARPAGPRTSLVVDPPDGRIPALTPEAQRRNEVQRDWRLMLLRSTETCRLGGSGCTGGEYGPASPRRFDVVPFYNTGRMNRHFGPEDQSLGDRCMSGRTPDFNGFRRIVQGEDSGRHRLRHRAGPGVPPHRQPGRQPSAEHRPPAARRLAWPLGGPDPGRRDHQLLAQVHPTAESGGNRRLVERYTRIDDDTLEYEVTVEDPTVWTAPWTARQELKRQSDEQNRIYYEPRCHEGNYGLPALLIGARVDERAFADGRGPDPFSLDTATCVTGLQD